MPRFFLSPSTNEQIPYPEKPLFQEQLINDEALACVLYVQHAMMSEHEVAISLSEMISEAVLDWYDVTGQYKMADYAHQRAKAAKTKSKAKKRTQMFGAGDAILARQMGIRLD